MALLLQALRLWGSLFSEGTMGLTLNQFRLWFLSSLGGGIYTSFSPLHSVPQSPQTLIRGFIYIYQGCCNHTHHPCTQLCWFPIAAAMDVFMHLNSIGLLFIGLKVRSLKWVMWGYSGLRCCLGCFSSGGCMGDSFLTFSMEGILGLWYPSVFRSSNDGLFCLS